MSSEAIQADGIWSSLGEDGVARLEIDRPGQLNALDDRASARIIELCRQWSDDPAVRVLVLSGRGGAFSAGADVAGMAGSALAAGGAGGFDEADSRAIIENGSQLVSAVRSVPVPVVAALDGAAVGIGASLAVAADLVYATARSYFMLAFVNIGLMPDGAASATFAASVGRARANAMALLGEKLWAAEAFDYGLINGFVEEAEALESVVNRVVAKLLRTSRSALVATKSAMDAHTLSGFGAAVDREIAGQTQLLQSPEFTAALRAFASGGQ